MRSTSLRLVLVAVIAAAIAVPSVQAVSIPTENGDHGLSQMWLESWSWLGVLLPSFDHDAARSRTKETSYRRLHPETGCNLDPNGQKCPSDVPGLRGGLRAHEWGL